MQDEPSETLKDRVLESTVTRTGEPYAVKRSVGLKAALIAASITVFVLVTGFAYGAEIIATIQQFMFGESSAVQVEELNGGRGVIGFRIVNRSLADSTKHDGVTQFTSIEEANQFATFTIKAPRYLPENVIGLEYVAVQRYTDGSAGYDVYVHYRVEIPNGTDGLNLNQYYAGPDAHVELETVHSIQKVMVGDIEASLVYAEDSMARYSLYWLKDCILYELTSGGSFDLETILAIAESV